MTTDSFVPLPGSERSALPGAEVTGPVDPSQRIEVTLVTRHRSAVPEALILGPETLTQEQFAQRHGTDPADVDLIRTVLGRYGLEVTEADAGARRVKVAGPVSAMTEAFGAELSMARSPHPVPGAPPAEHRYRRGSLHLPAELDGVVLAVLGLDNRPQARPHFRHAPSVTAEAAGTGAAPAPAPTSYTPPQVAAAYQFPANTDGTGQALAIVELGGGFQTSDLDTYFGGLGIAVPSVTAVGVDGASNVPGQDPNGADGEVELDIEVAGAVAPGAAMVVYFAPNTDQGFVDGVTTAIHASPTPAVVSISWGQSEDAWTAQGRSALDQAMADAAALGVTVTTAAGDNGSTDGVNDGANHTDFPSSSPHALACGGTSLRADPATGVISSETVWNDGTGGGATGGGISDVFPLPSWQSSAGVTPDTGRGVPDVAGCADPQTGYQVLVDGQQTVIGGTSAVAPLWAALICRLSQATGKKFGLLQPLLYAGVTAGEAAAGFTDITQGNNTQGSVTGYSAGPGWDACTGLGSPEGTTLLSELKG